MSTMLLSNVYITTIMILTIHGQKMDVLLKCPGSQLPDEIKLPSHVLTDSTETSFRLQSENWKCLYGSEKYIIRTKANNSTLLDETSHNENMETGKLSRAGVLEAQLEGISGYYKPADYCVESLDDSELVLQVCKIRCGGKVTCVPKCCQLDKAFASSPKPKCSSIGQQVWSPIMSYGNSSKPCLSSNNCVQEDWSDQQIHYTLHTPCDDYHFHHSDSEQFQLLVNGSVLFSNGVVVSSDFCLDGLINEKGVLTAQMIGLCAKVESENERLRGFEVTLHKCPGSKLPDAIHVPSVVMADHSEPIINLQSGDFKCSYGYGSEELIIPTIPLNVTSVDEEIPDEELEDPAGPLLSNGYLEARFQEHSGLSGYYKPDDYCIESMDKTKLVLQVCKIRCGGKITCIPKCCGVFLSLTLPIPDCLSTGREEWSPINEYGKSSKPCLSSNNCVHEDWSKQQIHYIRPTPCDDYHFQDSESSDSIPFQVLVNGSILYSNSIVSTDFCLDGLLNDHGKLTGQVLGTCAKEETVKEKEERKTIERFSLIYSIMMYLSSFFLLMTAVVYILIWDKHNLHGYTVFSHSVSMFFMLVFLGTSHLMSLFLYRDSARSFPCTAVALLSHFFFLSTFCWLTMLNFDLWWTFKTLSPTIAKSKGLQRFLYYSLFAWGIPTFFVLFAFIIDETHSKDSTSIPLPLYGVDRCYIDSHAQGYFVYLPIGTLLCVNLIFFGTTVFTMYKYQQSTRSARQGQSNGQSQSFQLFVKLFCVMGVTWIFEVISWVASAEGKVSLGWIAFDIINLLQGIAIFIIFVCKRQVLSHLWNKYPNLRWCLTPITQLPCCKPTTGMDVEGREISGGRTTQSNISMKNYSRSNSLSEA